MHLISGSHDGSIKVWDLRNYRCVSEVENAHARKYDESVMCLNVFGNSPFFGSGGGDSTVNIYELFV
jgi:WD40 repeat protein